MNDGFLQKNGNRRGEKENGEEEEEEKDFMD